ncbi:hypothetical protein BVRB_7g158330 [Beta vulgaris subsp. vulgaris]|nr:hypothetical protein BVRB_7g158330 [Beta vulgaris subsp. vulgaris]
MPAARIPHKCRSNANMFAAEESYMQTHGQRSTIPHYLLPLLLH